MQFAILLRAVAASALLFATGCLGARGDIEVVEARLRQQQDLADRYARDLRTVEQERDAARQDADLLRKQMADAGQTAIPAELAQSLFQVRGIEFNSLMTGGRDRDGQPGDDVLVAVFVPRDEHGDVVKLPGAIELEAIDLNRPESERQFGKWIFTAEESRKLWKSGAFSSGYQVVVPLPAGATENEKVILHARLATADGRQFDATHTVSIKPGALASRQSPPLAPPAEAAGRARITPVAHEEPSSVTNQRQPRPTAEPLGREPASPAVPQPSDDAFTPPASETADPFAESPTETTNPFAPAAGSTTAKKPAPVEGDTSAQPLPFPLQDGTKSSDNFTDETIPFLR